MDRQERVKQIVICAVEMQYLLLRGKWQLNDSVLEIKELTHKKNMTDMWKSYRIKVLFLDPCPISCWI